MSEECWNSLGQSVLEVGLNTERMACDWDQSGSEHRTRYSGRYSVEHRTISKRYLASLGLVELEVHRDMQAGQCFDLMDYSIDSEIPAEFGLVDHGMMVETIQKWCFDLADRNKLD